MRNKTLISLSMAAMMILGGLLAAMPFADQANASDHFIELADTSDLVWRPYGYITTSGSTLPDSTVLIDHVRKIREDLAIESLRVNTVNLRPSSITQAETLAAVDDAETKWEDASELYTRQPEWNVIEDNTDTPSLFDAQCTGGVNDDNINDGDGLFQVGFCDIGSDTLFTAITRFDPSATDMAANGFIDDYVEVDMAFQNTVSWDYSRMHDFARHELGHSYGFGDLYELWDGKGGLDGCLINEDVWPNYDDSNLESPQMCDNGQPITYGDTNGLFYLYPFDESLSMTESFSAKAIDIAAHPNISGSPSASPEFVLVEVDYDSTTNNNYFRIKPFEITDPDSYGDNAGVQEDLMWGSLSYIAGGAIRDVGAVFGNVDKSSDALDLVIVWVENNNQMYYRVLFDVTETSENLGWTSDTGKKGPLSGISSTAEAADAIFLDMDGASEIYPEELVIFSSHLSSGDKLDIYWADLPTTSSGSPPSNWHPNTSTGIALEDDAIGAGVISKTERLAFISFNSDDMVGAEYMGYMVVAFTSSGGIDEVAAKRLAPLDLTDDVSATLDGVGADALEFTGKRDTAYPDFIFLHVDDNAIKFVVERDGRYASHGTSDLS